MPTAPDRPDGAVCGGCRAAVSNDPGLAQLLRHARQIAIVGLSPRRERQSHGVGRYLQRAGYTIIPVNPAGGTTLREPVFENLVAAAAAAGPIDVVNVFRRSEFVAELLPAILQVRPSLVWLQQGVQDAETARRLGEAGIPVIMDRCLAVFHQLMGV